MVNITKGVVVKPPLITIYGPEGIGKTTWGASAPGALVLDIEGGSNALDVARVAAGDLNSYGAFLETLTWLHQEDHGFQTVIVDSADWLEDLVFAKVAGDAGKQTVGDIGYGVGYQTAANTFQYILQGLEALRDSKNICVIMVAHSEIRRFDNPITESYDRYQPKLYKDIGALLIEWSDCLLFANQEVMIDTKEKRFNKSINKGKGGDRVLYTTESPAYRAKNRYGLPEQLPLSWDAFAQAMTQSQQQSKGE